MAHTYTHLLVHYVFSTKRRQKVISPEIQARLWPYMGGICKNHNFIPFAIGGTNDHAHLLIGLPPTISISKAIQIIKGNSSKWIHENFPGLNHFAWQEGYGAFSISISHIKRTVDYIANQKIHHEIHTFQEEYRAVLKKHGVEFDEQYTWG